MTKALKLYVTLIGEKVSHIEVDGTILCVSARYKGHPTAEPEKTVCKNCEKLALLQLSEELGNDLPKPGA